MSRFANADEAREYWQHKHPPALAIHRARRHPATGEPMDWDCRCFIQPQDSAIRDIAGKVLRDTANETALAALTYEARHTRYFADDQQFRRPEEWMFPRETLVAKAGDCEDGAVKLASTLIAAGIPRWRVRVACGLVESGHYAQLGGHAYVCYVRDPDYEIAALDWCYHRRTSVDGPIERWPLLKDDTRYRDVWFSFNDQDSWGHTDWVIGGRLVNQLPRRAA